MVTSQEKRVTNWVAWDNESTFERTHCYTRHEKSSKIIPLEQRLLRANFSTELRIYIGLQKKYHFNSKEIWDEKWTRIVERIWANTTVQLRTGIHRKLYPCVLPAPSIELISAMRRMMLINIIFFIALVVFFFMVLQDHFCLDLADVDVFLSSSKL